MAKEIIMPQIAQDMEVGVVVQWLKKENDPVEKGEPVCEVEADKGVFQIEAEESGVLLKILRQEGEQVKMLEPIGYLGQAGENLD